MASLIKGPWLNKRNSPDDPEEFRATLIEHLEELRSRLVYSLLFIAGGWLIGWLSESWFYEHLNNMVTAAIKRNLPKGAIYIPAFDTATEPFMLQLRLSFLIGIVLALPFLVLQIWAFIAPGLKPNERTPFKRLAPFTFLLFATGATFSWLILPTAISWFTGYLVNFPGTSLIQDPGTMIFFCLKMILAFGLGFQLPVVVWALGALNLLSAETLIKYWRQSATGIFIVAAIVTPSNDAFSMLMMAIPLVILFIISVYAVKFTQAKQKRQREAEEAARYAE